MNRLGVALALAAIAVGAARAETSGAGPTGFTVAHKQEVAADAERLWAALLQLPSWWNSRHTWSGSATNLSLDARAGGCWCETWDGASVQHGTVTFVLPRRMLRIDAHLGPLHDRPINGVLAFGLEAAGAKSVLRVTYKVAGPPDAGLAELAPAVDRVIGEQVQRLARFTETGKPD